MTDASLQTFQNWTFRLRRTRPRSRRLLLLLHGWMGDEDSMWVLARNIPQDYTILAPRAPFPVPEGGFSWREVQPGNTKLPSIEDLTPSAHALMEFLDGWCSSEGMNPLRFDLMGFSQGAAMTYTLTLAFPDRINRLAALSGFIPEGAEELLTGRPLSGRQVFVAHGRQDDRVPVQQARQAVEWLKQAGADVTYCESDAAHKVSKECLRGMEMFFRAD